MNIAYTHDVFSSQPHGGISRYFVALIESLRGLDKTSTFRVFGGLHINEYLNDLRGVNGFKIPPFKYSGVFRRSINNVLQNVWINMHHTEIVHQTYYSDFVFNEKARVVLTVPDMIHEFYPESFSDRGMTSVLKKRCCDRANKIIAISNATKKDLVNTFGINPLKIHVIYLANPFEAIKPALVNRKTNSNYILFVGDRHGYKNFDALMQAYAHSEKIKESFELVCFGGGSFSGSERKNIRELGVESKIHHVSGNDSILALCYQNARALIYPSLCEGFGLPLLEAMSYSCPVISSNVAAIPEVVGNAGVYFDPKNSENIREVLEKTLFDDLLLKDLEKKGIERNKQFSWEKCARETLSIYRSLCN